MKYKIKHVRNKIKKHPLLMELYRLASIIFGGVLVALGLQAFLIPNGFIDGGVTGVSIILSKLIPLPVGIFIAVLNVPFVILVWIKRGDKSAFRTALGVASLAIFAVIFHHMTPWTSNFILALGYGGLFLGVGIGLALRHSGALDGTDSLASIISSNSRWSVDQLILAVNMLVFGVAALLLEAQAAMASALLYYVVVTPIIRKVVDAGSRMKQARILTMNSQAVAAAALKVTHRRITTISRNIYDVGKRSKEITEVSFTVSLLEEALVIEAILDIDSDAIISFTDISTLRGGAYEQDQEQSV